MSARRDARARTGIALDGTGGVPRSLAVGRCIEVWCAEPNPATQFDIASIASTRSRFNDARSWWLAQAGITDKESWAVIPGGSHWSAVYLMATRREKLAVDRLTRARATFSEIEALRAEAEELHASATRLLRRTRRSSSSS